MKQHEELTLAGEEDASFDFGFTVDPELALETEGVEGPRPLVSETMREHEPPYEVTLVMDPDGYMFGACRDWSFTVESLVAGFGPWKMLQQMIAATTIEWAQGETTEAIERHLQQTYMPILRKRDRIVACSLDGERTIRLTKMRCERIDNTANPTRTK